MKELLKYFDFRRKKTKYVLSLDGGGVRAIAALVFLKHLEAASGKNIFDIFDFFYWHECRRH